MEKLQSKYGIFFLLEAGGSILAVKEDDQIIDDFFSGLRLEVKKYGTPNSVGSRLLDLFDKRGSHFNELDIGFLNIITRKVDIAKNLCKAYDSEWRKPLDREVVSDVCLFCTIICMVRIAESGIQGTPLECLRWANTAFNVIEMLKLRGFKDINKLRWVNNLVEVRTKNLLAEIVEQHGCD